MTYVAHMQLPAQVRKAFTYEDAEEWRRLYNEYFESKYGSPRPDDAVTVMADEICNDAYVHAWNNMMYAKSSRSFTAQVAVEDEDSQGETPLLEKYIALAETDIVWDGGIGIDKHTSRATWCVWDVTLGKDDQGRNALIIKGNFFRDKPMFDVVWETFLRGRSQFSLGTHTEREYRCNGGTCRVYAIPNQWFEISIVDVGASPNTGIIDIHVPEGEGEFNPKNHIEGSTYEFKETDGEGFDNFCGIEFAYNGLKNEIGVSFPDHECDIEWICTLPGEGGEGCSPGNRGFHIWSKLKHKDELMSMVDKWCAEVFIYSQPMYFDPVDGDGEEPVMAVIGYPAIDATPLTVADVIHLLMDEEEAITMYDEAIGKARKLVGEDVESDYIHKLIHIRDEEKEHIEELKDLLNRLLYKQSIYMTNLPDLKEREMETEDDYEDDNISQKDAQGKYDGARICPAGQHSHIGIAGCHDITQTHALDIQMIREGLIDISNEDIDIDAIKGASTDRLKAIVLTIAKVISEYSRPEAMKFMSSSMGKEFALMLTELVDRREKEQRKRDDMSKETESKISEKMDLDPAGDMQNLVSLLAEIQAGIKQLSQTIMELKSSNMAGREQGGSIADAVSSAVESIGTTEGAEGDGEGGGGEEAVVEPAPEGEGEGKGQEEESESDTEVPKPKSEEDEGEEKKTEDEDGGDEGKEEKEEKGEEPESDEKKTESEEEKDEGDKKPKEEDVKETDGEPGKPAKTVDEPASDEPEDDIAEKAGSEMPTSEVPPAVNANVNSGGTADIIPNAVVGDEPVVETTDTTLGELAPEGISLKEGFTDGAGVAARTTPPGVGPGPIGKQLQSVADNSIPNGYKESDLYSLEGWANQGASLMGGGQMVREVENTPLETKISLKSADPNMKVIEPESVFEGTGLKYTDGEKNRSSYVDLWNSIGTENFDKVFEEVNKC